MYSDEYNNEEMNQNYEETNNSNNSSSNKKMLWIVIAAIILVLIVILYLWLGSGDKPETPGTIIPQITISSQKENLSLGNSLPLKAIVTNIQNATIVWTSSNEAVATVDNMGNVTGINYGTAIITATYLHTDNQPYSISCEVTILKGDPNILLTNVKFPEGEVLISEGDEFEIKLVVEPADAYVVNPKYTSTDETIATVDQNGKIKGIKEGTAKIRLNVNDGEFPDEIVVNVTKEQVEPQIFVPVSSINFDKQLIKIVLGQSEKLNYEISPDNTTISDLKWNSSDPTIASVDQGIVSALKVGTTEITVTSLNGVDATITVEVTEKNVPVTRIEVLNKSDAENNGGLSFGTNIKNTILNLKVGDTEQILANVKPDNATNKEILYKSDKESVATVDEKGLITAKSKGTATITLTSKSDVSKTTKINVIVSTNSTNSTTPGISPNTGSLKVNLISNPIKIDEEGKVTVDGDKKITRCYSTRTEYVDKVTISDDKTECKFRGKAVGSATIVVFSGDYSASVSVTVEDGSGGNNQSGSDNQTGGNDQSGSDNQTGGNDQTSDDDKDDGESNGTSSGTQPEFSWKKRNVFISLNKCKEDTVQNIESCDGTKDSCEVCVEKKEYYYFFTYDCTKNGSNIGDGILVKNALIRYPTEEGAKAGCDMKKEETKKKCKGYEEFKILEDCETQFIQQYESTTYYKITN